MRRAALPLLALLVIGAGWLDPHATARQASHLYDAGKFADAAGKYREALVDDPDSPLLHFNLGAADFRDGKYDDAARAFADAAASQGDPQRSARAAYNLGNTKYREGAAQESANPQQALGSWAEALVAYRRALGADPADEDAKFNYEFVSKRLADLQKKLEEQQQKKDQQQQQKSGEKQNQEQQPQGQPDPDKQNEQQPQGGQQQADQKQSQQPQAEQPQAGGDPKENDQQKAQQDTADAKPQPDAGQQSQQASEGRPSDGNAQHRQDGTGDGDVAGEPQQMSQRDAKALLDAQRDQEVRPGEIVRQLQGVDVAEPREDW